MNEEQNQPPDREPLPLDYQSPSSAPKRANVVLSLIGGSVLGITVTAFFGFIAAFSTNSPGGGFRLAALFGLIGVVAFIAAVNVIKNWPERRQYVLAGFLLGAGIAWLSEGLCFSSFH